MQLRRVLAATSLLAATAALAGCGGGSSSSSASSGIPSDASKTTFCKTFDDLGADVTPKEAADKMASVGTPGDIDSGARHGFEVLVEHLRALPDDAKEQDLTQMAQGLKAGDQADVVAFIRYFTSECGLLPSASSS